MDKKTWLLDLSADELYDELRPLSLKTFVVRQIRQWLFLKNNSDISTWTNISADNRLRLAQRFHAALPEVLREEDDGQGTHKFLLKLADGERIESVLIPEKDHSTLCVSSQAGCPLRCAFCATGKLGLRRNLSSGEILAQVLLMRRRLEPGGKLNLVFMGMGEPLLNYDNLKRALETITAEEGMAISPRHVTVSTAGVLGNLKRLEEDFPLLKIAFSLNAADAETRRRLMPISQVERLDDILAWFRSRKRRHRITFEYVLIAGVNDSAADARKLTRLIHGIPSKVNIIPLNESPSCDFHAPAVETVEAFQQLLMERGLTAVVRWSKGGAIRSACGQLTAQAETE
jgi:23S rRNA (adenine2503-C2)-methyltransferase